MQLITMAHLGEAQGVIETFQLKKVRPDLFTSEDLVLILTGEGPFEAATKTAMACGQYAFESIINLGIAGTLKAEFKKGEIHPVRSIYLLQDLKPQFKTYQSFERGLDCLTSFERILHPEKAEKLKGLGVLVDREAWGVAMAAKTAGVPFSCYKLISDVAGTIESCELIKETAAEFSELMVNFLVDKLTPKAIEKHNLTEISGFHFTFSTHHRFINLLNKLKIKEDHSEEEVLQSLALEEIRLEKSLPKERTRILLEQMEERIDPFKTLLNKEKFTWALPFERQGIKLQTDPSWEDPNVTVTFQASSNLELAQRIESLKSLSLDPFTRLMNGELDVE